MPEMGRLTQMSKNNFTWKSSKIIAFVINLRKVHRQMNAMSNINNSEYNI